MIAGRSHYETWVLTLRDWQTNPHRSLDGLPPLTEDDLPREAFTRLIDHITAALDAVTKHWDERLAKQMQDARSDFELAQALIESRRWLRRRVELARHPSLPEVLRRAFDESCTRDIERFQQDLEQAIRDGGANTPDQAYWAGRLRVVRENPLTAVLADAPPPPPEVLPAAPRLVAALPAADPAAQPAPSVSRWAHRRIIRGS